MPNLGWLEKICKCAFDISPQPQQHLPMTLKASGRFAHSNNWAQSTFLISKVFIQHSFSVMLKKCPFLTPQLLNWLFQSISPFLWKSNQLQVLTYHPGVPYSHICLTGFNLNLSQARNVNPESVEETATKSLVHLISTFFLLCISIVIGWSESFW